MQPHNNLTKVKQLVRNLETNPGHMFAVTYAFT